jgi:hypothetical protein
MDTDIHDLRRSHELGLTSRWSSHNIHAMPDATKKSTAKAVLVETATTPQKVVVKSFAEWQQVARVETEADRLKHSLEMHLAAQQEELARLKTLPRTQVGDNLRRTETAIANIQERLKEYD